MTGRDLIIYILENNLEDKPVFEDNKILGFMNTKEAALHYGVGPNTIVLWVKLNIIPSITIGGEHFIPINAKKETM